MDWPLHLPDSCPPSDATSKKITIYRFLFKNNEVCQINFLSKREENPARRYDELDKECKACGLSVLADRDEVIRLQRKVPRYRYPSAVANLTEDAGKVKHTPDRRNKMNSHHTWWVPAEIKPWELFGEIIEPPSV